MNVRVNDLISHFFRVYFVNIRERSTVLWLIHLRYRLHWLITRFHAFWFYFHRFSFTWWFLIVCIGCLSRILIKFLLLHLKSIKVIELRLTWFADIRAIGLDFIIFEDYSIVLVIFHFASCYLLYVIFSILIVLLSLTRVNSILISSAWSQASMRSTILIFKWPLHINCFRCPIR